MSDAAQAAEVWAGADGVVVGSALVRRVLAEEGPAGAAAFVGSIRAAGSDTSSSPPKRGGVAPRTVSLPLATAAWRTRTPDASSSATSRKKRGPCRRKRIAVGSAAPRSTAICSCTQAWMARARAASPSIPSQIARAASSIQGEERPRKRLAARI
ncbi:MAG: hypothetical protein ACO4CT_15685 [Planctomycetota bacterium]